MSSFLLYHYPLCPLSRFIRILLHEMKIDFDELLEDLLNKSPTFIQLHPMGTLPVLVVDDVLMLRGIHGITEYFKDTFGGVYFGHSQSEKAYIRFILDLFNKDFFFEVTSHVLVEKVIKYLNKGAVPNSNALRIANKNLAFYMSYIDGVIGERYHLCESGITVADHMIAAHLSVLDFLNYISWDKYKNLKNWYSILKSKPSFKMILQDVIHGIPRAPHYPKLDF